MHGSLVVALRARVSQHPDRTALIFLAADRSAAHFTYGQLDLDARRYAGLLRANDVQPGDRVIVAFEHGYELVAAFWGALYCGAVPTIFPYRDATGSGEARQHRLTGLATFTGAQAVLCPPDVQAEAAGWPAGQATKALSLAEDAEPLAEALLSPRSGEEIAYIQFSSGATGTPKGVMLSHRAVLANVNAQTAMLSFNDCDVCVHWLPFYHDMGLLGAVFLPLFTSALSVSMTPAAWIRRPHLLFSAIDRYRGTMTWMPNFAFNHCLRTMRDEHLTGLDLSSWRILGNGSEPVQPAALQRFIERFSRWGLDPTALTVGYGLAENVVAVSFTQPGQVPRTKVVVQVDLQRARHATRLGSPTAGAKQLASCGPPVPGVAVRIVDDAGQPLPERSVGELLIAGPSLFSGYFGDAERTTQVLRDGWFYTGDLGYLADGELYICGRRKDLIIVGGQNIYPESIEALAREVLGEQVRQVAAFAVLDEALGTEQPVLVCELRSSADDEEQAHLAEMVRARVRAELDMALADVRFARGMIERTTSGKVARSATRKNYLAAGYRPEPTAVALSPVLLANPAVLKAALTALASQMLGVTSLGPTDNLFAAGGDSLTVVRFVLAVEEQLNVQLAADFFHNPTTDHLVHLLCPQGDAAPAPALQGKSARPRARCQPRHAGWISRGPLLRGRPLLPYGLGVRVQRAWLALPAVRRQLSADIEVVQRWGELAGLTDCTDSVEASLLANTWRNWRVRVLDAPLGASPWVTALGDPTLWQPQRDGAGTIFMPLHTPLSALFLRGLAASGIRSCAVRGATDEAETRVQDRALQVYCAHEVLGQGGVVIVMGDGGKGEQGVVVPFFGGRRLFRQGAAELAVRTGACLVPVFCTMATTGRMTVEVLPPLVAPDGSFQSQVEALTRAYADLVVARWPQVFASLDWGNLDTWLRKLAKGVL